MMPTKKFRHTTSRYNLTLRTDTYAELQEIAADKGITFVELMRKFIKLGLIVVALEDEPNSRLIIRNDHIEKEIILI
jgi:hypothetical protein